ncbi:UNVERIFIED_CONTAM: F-box/LRR-repeat protein [Sesamum calycinum]|uniref:F-box/LRR-repeat protein n=1 Tax=Sesamum calycinum TaxID=2727403 RepID=A0AAW2MCQ0_9LAMI
MAATSIDDLPEALLLRILSFLPTINAVRASLVSRGWRDLWRHVPRLNFDMSLYHSPPNALCESREFFADFVTQTLLLREHSTLLYSFHLLFNYRDYRRTTTQVNSWVRYAIASGVVVLLLSFPEDLFVKSEVDSYADVTWEKYDFHFSKIRNSWVSCLALDYCRIVWPKSLPCDGFSSLRSLYLCNVSLRAKVLDNVVSSCVNLEFLSLSCISYLRNFKIHSQTLKELELELFKIRRYKDAGSLEIYAPNLHRISFDRFSVAEYCSRDLSSLVEANVEFWDEDREGFNCEVLQILTVVERLTLLDMCFNRYAWDEVCATKSTSVSLVFKNLKFLELKIGYTEDKLLEIAEFFELCPVLETLVLDYYVERDFLFSEYFKSKPPIFHIPNLKQVKMRNYRGTEMELQLTVIFQQEAARQKVFWYHRPLQWLYETVNPQYTDEAIFLGFTLYTVIPYCFFSVTEMPIGFFLRSSPALGLI